MSRWLNIVAHFVDGKVRNKEMTEELLLKLQEYGYNEIPSFDYMLSRLDQYGYYPDILAFRPDRYECVLNRMNYFVNELEPLLSKKFIGNSRKEAVAKAFLWAMEENSKSWQRVLELGAKLGDRLKEAGITEEQIKEDVRRIRKKKLERKKGHERFYRMFKTIVK